MIYVLATVILPFETYFDPFSGTMIEDIGDDDVFVAERDVKIPEGMLVHFIENLSFRTTLESKV